MPKKDRSVEILERIKKNDSRFKDMIIKKTHIDMPTYEEIFGKKSNIDDKKRNRDIVYVNESNNHSE